MPLPDRRPRYRSFLITGGVAGLALSILLLSIFDPAAGGADRTELTLLLTVFLVGTGVLLGGAFAVLSEGRTRAARRAREKAGESTPSP